MGCGDIPDPNYNMDFGMKMLHAVTCDMSGIEHYLILFIQTPLRGKQYHTIVNMRILRFMNIMQFAQIYR